MENISKVKTKSMVSGQRQMGIYNPPPGKKHE